jgi:hypothetical protein
VRILKKEVDNYRRAMEGSKRQKTHTSHFEDRSADIAEDRRALSKRGESKI